MYWYCIIYFYILCIVYLCLVESIDCKGAAHTLFITVTGIWKHLWRMHACTIPIQLRSFHLASTCIVYSAAVGTHVLWVVGVRMEHGVP